MDWFGRWSGRLAAVGFLIGAVAGGAAVALLGLGLLFLAAGWFTTVVLR